MSIPAVAAISAGISPVTATSYVQPSTGAGAVAGAGSASATGFASALSSVDQLQQMQSTTDSLAVKAVTGSLTDVHDYTVAASESKLAIELTAAVRNKAIDAFTEIMRMQA